MSSHCGRYPNCGCSKEVGTKCHLPDDHSKLKEQVIDGNELSAALAITLGEQMNDLRRSVHVMENNAAQIAKSKKSKFTPRKKKRRK